MPKDQLGSEQWRRIGNGCGPGGPRDPSRSWQRGRQESTGPAGRLAVRAERKQSGGGPGGARQRPAGRRPGRKAATRCSGGRNMLQQIRDPDGERELEMRWSRPGRAGLKKPTPEAWS